ncbi:MAG: N-acetyltransferase family protein [Halodesulfurarchaeum sp.]
MSRNRRYPESTSGPFPAPPETVEDETGRRIDIEAYNGQRERLVEMYADFDPADRAQGIPPVGEDRIDTWLDALLDENCYNVIAKHGGDVIGHATLVGDDEGAYELAIFVLQDYQGVGIGEELLERLLGFGQRQGITCVWLTVERWNRPAINLYKKVGFETTDAQSFEHEMSIRLGGGSRSRDLDDSETER